MNQNSSTASPSPNTAAATAPARPGLDLIPWPIRTDRLVLRRLRPTDLDRLWEYRSLPEVHQWLGGSITDFAAFEARFPSICEHGIAVELDGRVIGDLRAVVGDAWSQVGMEHLAKNTEAVLGWVFDPEAAGRGYATESVGALITACFAHLGVRRVSGSCFAANEPSARLMKRLGMRLEEHSRKTALHRSGEWMDTMMFGVLADDWPER
ncbi:GNAT family N-acetyltransferase [Helcobacillus massiliensis]|uniref:GNAT family N-acetyltransferase n=1 Tax=Helcobacillus massiliensis TaxID=521392 RepID=UPI002557B12E|nr:GNAT family protein [Helcobacillus massiliensis]MDK7743066.1 GNAT family protein [Helcobacillus massiliensis]WOO92728.1 GNAT family protein [Helcobacillus massiliensis]